MKCIRVILILSLISTGLNGCDGTNSGDIQPLSIAFSDRSFGCGNAHVKKSSVDRRSAIAVKAKLKNLVESPEVGDFLELDLSEISREDLNVVFETDSGSPYTSLQSICNDVLYGGDTTEPLRYEATSGMVRIQFLTVPEELVETCSGASDYRISVELVDVQLNSVDPDEGSNFELDSLDFGSVQVGFCVG